MLKETGPPYEAEDDKNEREAFVNRCVYHYMSKTYPSKLNSFPYESHQLAKWFHKRWLEILAEKADDDLIELGKRQLEDTELELDSDDIADILSDVEEMSVPQL